MRFRLRQLKKICCYGLCVTCFILCITILQPFQYLQRVEVRYDLEPRKVDIFTSRLSSEVKDSRNQTKSVGKLETVLENLDTRAKRHPFKFYIYNLPAKFNDKLVQCLKNHPGYQTCFDLTNQGMGKILNTQDEYVTMDTNQFSLEVIVHHQLLHHPYRTFNLSEADIFYVPAYIGLACFCFNTAEKRYQIITEFYNYLSKLKPFRESKPHFSTLAKIEREQSSNSCPLLKFKLSGKMTFIAIERETNLLSRKHLQTKTFETIVAPYPSYVHFKKPKIKFPGITDRKVFLFFAASVRRTNLFRALLIDQFQNKTTDGYEKFFKNIENKNVTQVMLVTQECLGNHKYTTVPWMRHSVFCLEPPGDSPTRKSFYDAILSGCIPVLFHYIDQDPVHYSYDSYLNYSDFTVILPAAHGNKPYPDVFKTLSQIPSIEIQRLHANLVKVSQYFQYSFNFPEKSSTPTPDAMLLILDEIRKLYKINE